MWHALMLFRMCAQVAFPQFRDTADTPPLASLHAFYEVRGNAATFHFAPARCLPFSCAEALHILLAQPCFQQEAYLCMPGRKGMH